jgi:alpha-beta hydrolase superfamily lysophospholipase
VPRILWTVETARLAGLKSVETKRQRKLSQALVPVIAPVEANGGTDAYAEAQALTYRNQIKRLVELLERSRDATDCAKFAVAIDKLARHEAALSGRPSPGSLRPTRTQQRQSGPRNVQMIELQPDSMAPVPVQSTVSTAPTPSVDSAAPAHVPSVDSTMPV